MLGTITGGNVVLGYASHQIGSIIDAVDLLRLAFGDEIAERVFGPVFCRWASTACII